jgi:hypothetical protein
MSWQASADRAGATKALSAPSRALRALMTPEEYLEQRLERCVLAMRRLQSSLASRCLLSAISRRMILSSTMRSVDIKHQERSKASVLVPGPWVSSCRRRLRPCCWMTVCSRARWNDSCEPLRWCTLHHDPARISGDRDHRWRYRSGACKQSAKSARREWRPVSCLWDSSGTIRRLVQERTQQRCLSRYPVGLEPCWCCCSC